MTDTNEAAREERWKRRNALERQRKKDQKLFETAWNKKYSRFFWSTILLAAVVLPVLWFSLPRHGDDPNGFFVLAVGVFFISSMIFGWKWGLPPTLEFEETEEDDYFFEDFAHDALTLTSAIVAALTPKQLDGIEALLSKAKNVLDVENARLKFLRDNGIEDGSPLAEEINVIFTDYAVRLKDPNE